MPDSSAAFIRFSGAALLSGGVLAVLVNGILSPMLPAGEGSIAVYTSTAFSIRMPLAALVVALVTLGSVGLYLVQAERLRLGRLAFLLAGVGGMMVFWLEATQATLIPDLAFGDPEALLALEEAGALVRWDVGFAVAATIFTLGWLAVGVLTWRLGVIDRRGPMALVAGMFLVPILGAVASLWGMVVGNVVLGAGWALLGLDLRRVASGSSQRGHDDERSG